MPRCTWLSSHLDSGVSHLPWPSIWSWVHLPGEAAGSLSWPPTGPGQAGRKMPYRYSKGDHWLPAQSVQSMGICFQEHLFWRGSLRRRGGFRTDSQPQPGQAIWNCYRHGKRLLLPGGTSDYVDPSTTTLAVTPLEALPATTLEVFKRIFILAHCG